VTRGGWRGLLRGAGAAEAWCCTGGGMEDDLRRKFSCLLAGKTFPAEEVRNPILGVCEWGELPGGRDS